MLKNMLFGGKIKKKQKKISAYIKFYITLQRF